MPHTPANTVDYLEPLHFRGRRAERGCSGHHSLGASRYEYRSSTIPAEALVIEPLHGTRFAVLASIALALLVSWAALKLSMRLTFG